MRRVNEVNGCVGISRPPRGLNLDLERDSCKVGKKTRSTQAPPPGSEAAMNELPERGADNKNVFGPFLTKIRPIENQNPSSHRF